MAETFTFLVGQYTPAKAASDYPFLTAFSLLPRQLAAP
jgi:hypothetical protein